MDQRLTFVTRSSQLDAVDQWRAKFRPIPTRNEALRQLIDRGLEEFAKDEAEGAGDDE